MENLNVACEYCNKFPYTCNVHPDGALKYAWQRFGPMMEWRQELISKRAIDPVSLGRKVKRVHHEALCFTAHDALLMSAFLTPKGKVTSRVWVNGKLVMELDPRREVGKMTGDSKFVF